MKNNDLELMRDKNADKGNSANQIWEFRQRTDFNRLFINR